MNDVFPNATKGRVAVEVFVHLAVLQFSGLLKQRFVRFVKQFCIYKFGKI